MEAPFILLTPAHPVQKFCVPIVGARPSLNPRNWFIESPSIAILSQYQQVRGKKIHEKFFRFFAWRCNALAFRAVPGPRSRLQHWHKDCGRRRGLWASESWRWSTMGWVRRRTYTSTGWAEINLDQIH